MHAPVPRTANTLARAVDPDAYEEADGDDDNGPDADAPTMDADAALFVDGARDTHLVFGFLMNVAPVMYGSTGVPTIVCDRRFHDGVAGSVDVEFARSASMSVAAAEDLAGSTRAARARARSIFRSARGRAVHDGV